MNYAEHSLTNWSCPSEQIEEFVAREVTEAISTALPVQPSSISFKFVHSPGRVGAVATIRARPVSSALQQFSPFRDGERSGFLVPLVRGWLQRACLEVDIPWQHIALDLEVDDRPGAEDLLAPYRFVDLSEAREHLDAQLARYLDLHGIQEILFAGGHVSGPSLGVLKACERLLERRVSLRHAVDLFSGSGSVADVLLEAGVSHVHSVDSLPIASCDRRSARFGSRWTYSVEDAFDELPGLCHETDLVVADPFYSDLHRFVRELSQISPCGGPRFVILNAGKAHLPHAQRRLDAERVPSEYDTLFESHIGGERVLTLEARN
ncbi:MAG: class I SAM-dependent methyltransferase [bacterium]|nr:class I SAM-dependent methyltransferase [bacterium]